MRIRALPFTYCKCIQPLRPHSACVFKANLLSITWENIKNSNKYFQYLKYQKDGIWVPGEHFLHRFNKVTSSTNVDIICSSEFCLLAKVLPGQDLCYQEKNLWSRLALFLTTLASWKSISPEPANFRSWFLASFESASGVLGDFFLDFRLWNIEYDNTQPYFLKSNSPRP